MPRYLVVDDSRAIRVALGDTLRKIDASAVVVEAVDGETALKAFVEDRFDLVFLDLVMPGPVDGLATLRRMLEMEPRTRVAVVTGLPDGTPEVVEALSVGAFAYVRKPVTAELVRQTLERVGRESGRSSSIR